MRGLVDRAADRRGGTLVLTAVMMTALLGFTALAVDTMVLAVARNQLNIASDSGALAGASALADERRLNPSTSLDVVFTSARAQARLFAEHNKVLGRMPVIVNNAGNDPGGDVVLGYIADPNDPASPFLTNASLAPQFNSVQVRASRSADRGGLVPAFFSRIFGHEGSSVRATGTASALIYSIAGFNNESQRNADLLPFALHKDTYYDMIDPQGTIAKDEYRFNPATGAVSKGADGIRESPIFPLRTTSGNWGTVNVGVDNNSTNTLRDQIRNGISPQQLATFPNGEITLHNVDAKGDDYLMLDGNPGISAGMESALEDIIGEPRTVPLYESVGGNGNNTAYKIVGFGSIRVMGVNFQGSNKHVIVQPALTRDPTAIPGEVQTSWTAGGLIRTNLSR